MFLLAEPPFVEECQNILTENLHEYELAFWISRLMDDLYAEDLITGFKGNGFAEVSPDVYRDLKNTGRL